jgi:uncharacterized membrane protein YgcG
VAQVPGGELLTSDQRQSIDRARTEASVASGLDFHVYVGGSGGEDPRAAAHRLLSTLPRAENAVLVFLDPAARALEIVTGSTAHRRLDDGACSLAALSMQAAFAAGDLAGGLVHGVHQLGDHAQQPASLHTGTP